MQGAQAAWAQIMLESAPTQLGLPAAPLPPLAPLGASSPHPRPAWLRLSLASVSSFTSYVM